eukprot:1218427-Prymnesium_polylepis.2
MRLHAQLGSRPGVCATCACSVVHWHVHWSGRPRWGRVAVPLTLGSGGLAHGSTRSRERRTCT